MKDPLPHPPKSDIETTVLFIRHAEKSKLLDELVEICGLNRKHAIKLMNRPVGSTVGRPET
jgi:hypothetical protein